jgi:hypothetical protein
MIKLTFREELANWITGGEFMVLKTMACLEGGLTDMAMVDRDTKLAALTSRIAELESQAKSISKLVNIVNDPKQSYSVAGLYHYSIPEIDKALEDYYSTVIDS